MDSPASLPLRRGDLTRERLLDAAERWVSEAGFDAPTHRGIGERAQVHTALVNYHFGSKEVLLEDMVERRSVRLVQEWQAALARARENGPLTPQSVLEAYWAPFLLVLDAAEPWRRYLCVVAHLFHDGERAASRKRHFGSVETAFREALTEAVPELAEDDIAFAFQCARHLLDESLFHHCGLAVGRGAPPGFRTQDVPRLIRFLAAGIATLPESPRVPAPPGGEQREDDASQRGPREGHEDPAGGDTPADAPPAVTRTTSADD